MNIKELKEFIEANNLPDEMPVGLLDLTTDDFYDSNYGIAEKNLIIEDCVKEEDGEITGKCCLSALKIHLMKTLFNWIENI